MYEFFMTNGKLNISRVVWCAVILFSLLKLIAVYNRLNRMLNNVKQFFSTIDVKLTQRNDGVKSLCESCRAYMVHENGTFEKIAQLRAQAMRLSAVSDEKMAIHSEISSLSRGLMLQVENYPELQSSTHISQLMRSINDIEEQISAVRRSFNAATTEYNTAIQSFPTCLYAWILRFKTQKLFEANEEDRKRPDVASMFR